MNLKIHPTLNLTIISFALIPTLPTIIESIYAEGEDGNTIGTTDGTT